MMLVDAVPPRESWKSTEASSGSTKESSLINGLPILPEESKSPKS